MNNSIQRDRDVRRVILIEGSANFAVLVAKVLVGFTTGSLAILADAAHSLTDLVNNVIAWTAIRISSAPPDLEHPYGHRKFETLAVFILASLLVVLAFELGLNAIKREDTEIVSSAWELGVMLGVLAINITLSSWERAWAKRLKSDILMADASHTFADVLVTATVIVGWQLSAMGHVWLDRLCALGVAMLVAYLAYTLFRRAIPILVDQSALDPELLARLVRNVSGVRQVNRVRSRWIGTDMAIDIVIAVDPMLSTDESHNIADTIESLVEKRFDASDISIHVEPYNEQSDEP